MSAEQRCEATTTGWPSLTWAGLGTDATLGEPDLAYLLTAQMLVRRDRISGMLRLGIPVELVDLLEQLSPQQLARMATSSWRCDGAAARADHLPRVIGEGTHGQHGAARHPLSSHPSPIPLRETP